MKHASLFSGVGGFDLAAQLMGWENAFHCEWNPFAQNILKHYWPKAKSYADITKSDFTLWSGKIDIITGGFPCQPYSLAGKRKGKDDERHLWPQMLRAIREIQPCWVVGENVFGLIGWDGGLVFNEVQADLEAEGYEVFPYVLPACAVNAPHRRDRVWFVAYASNKGPRHQIRRRNGKEEHNGTSVFIKNGPFTNSESIGRCPRIRKDADSVGKWESSEHITEGSEIWNRNTAAGRTRVFTDADKLNGDISGFCSSSLPQFETSGVLRNSTDTNGFRLRGQIHGAGKSGFFNEAGPENDWTNFPTQSPICNGNDGLSARLDLDTVFKGFEKPFTFTKWRKESIKAGGNAIVPQVAMQIFKAIEAYNLNLFQQCKK